jgi:hypothetical protein
MKSESAVDPLKQVELNSLMNETSGNPQVTIGLIDGPVNFFYSGTMLMQPRTMNFAAESGAKS